MTQAPSEAMANAIHAPDCKFHGARRMGPPVCTCGASDAGGRDGVRVSYQARVKPWLDACFGPQIAIDKVERNHRFIEEALELVQSTGCTKSEAHQLVDYVYGRDIGDPDQEVGGVMNTLAALCLAHGLDMHEAGERELARVNQPHILEKIRAKQAAKPKHSPLPEALTDAPQPVQGSQGEAVAWRRLGKFKWFYREIPPTAQTPGDDWYPLYEHPATLAPSSGQNAEAGLREAMEEIADLENEEANAHLEKTGSYVAFEERHAVEKARAALKGSRT